MEGALGAGGGMMHIVYLGKPGVGCTGGDVGGFPPISELLELLHLSEKFQALRWMTTVDPLQEEGGSSTKPTKSRGDFLREIVALMMLL